jgi:5-formyltetrahydrofolate cyclo-ligase
MADGAPASGSAAAAKRVLRARLLAARRAASGAASDPAVRAALAAALGRFLDAAPAADAPATAAAYLSVGTEPPTSDLLALLHGRGVRVLLPLLRPDGDLDWAPHAPTGAVRPGLRGTLEPATTPLGLGAIAAAGLVLVPALAVDRKGHRLGRGGGGYDRALVRVSPGAVVLAVVFDDDVLDSVPAEPHDRPVSGALTPSGVQLFAPPGRAAR